MPAASASAGDAPTSPASPALESPLMTPDEVGLHSLPGIRLATWNTGCHQLNHVLTHNNNVVKKCQPYDEEVLMVSAALQHVGPALAAPCTRRYCVAGCLLPAMMRAAAAAAHNLSRDKQVGLYKLNAVDP
jgi:hypothetical protein